MHHYNLEKKMESMVCKHSIWSAKSRFKTTVNVRKVMATIFCNIQSIFTFSELCIMIYVRMTNKMHTFSH